MKHSKFLKFSIFGLLPIAMTLGVISAHQENPVKTNAYEKTGILPKNLNLNDCTDEEIKSYYSELSDKSESELKGDNLLKNLKPILSKNQKYYKYDNDSLWAMYEITDRDWEKSPASEISGYDETTNTVTNYTYGSSLSNKGSNPYIHALYVNRDVDNQTRAWDDHQQTQWGINQEHIWPKSQGFNEKGAGGARGDPMHLWAGNGRVNGTEHNNNMYGFVDKTKETTDPVTKLGFTNLSNNLSGYSLTMPEKDGSYDTVFEPQDSDKGDIARAIFYMVARYNDVAGNDPDINTNNPNLELTQDTRHLASYTSTSDNPGMMGVMSDLLAWNKLDPVDEYEIHRNNLLYRNFTNNRNPFIDYPEWADYIWGTVEYNGRNYISHDKNPAGSVNLETDVINGGNHEDETSTGFEKATKIYVGDKVSFVCDSKKIELTGFTTSGTNYGIGSSYTSGLNGTMLFDVVEGSQSGSFAFKNNDKYINWSSDNTLSLASSVTNNSSWKVIFSDGDAVISNVADPNRVIKWNSKSPRFAAYLSTSPQTNIQLYVKDMSIRVNSVSLDARTATVEVGNTIQLTPTVYPKDASNKNVRWTTDDPTVATVENGKVTAIKPGTATIMVITEDRSFVATCVVTVKNKPQLVSIEVSDDYQKIYEIGEEFNSEEIVVTAKYDNDVSKQIPLADVEISEVDTSTIGQKVVTVSYAGKTTTFKVFVCTAKFVLNSTLGIGNGEDVTTLTLNGITIKFDKGNGSIAPKYYSSGDAVRFYSGNYFKVSSTEKVANVSLNFAPSDPGGANTVSVNKGTLNNNDWSGNEDDVTFSFSDKRRIDCIYVTTASKPRIDHISASGLVKTQYFIGQPLDLTGLVVKAFFDDESEVTLNREDYEITGFKSFVVGPDYFTISYKDSYQTEKTTTVSYTVNEPEIKDLIISGTYKSVYEYGEAFTKKGLVVTAVYSDDSTLDVTTKAQYSNFVPTIVGTQVITVTYYGKTTSFEVVVKDMLDSIFLDGTRKTEFEYGEKFSYGNLQVKAVYMGGTVDVTDSAIFSGYNPEKLGKQTITVSYTDEESKVVKTSSYEINVSNYITGLKLSGDYKTNYAWGEEFSSVGMVVKTNMADGSEVVVNPVFSEFDPYTAGEQTITVSYAGMSTNYTVTVAEPKLTEITVSLIGQTSFIYGEEFKHDQVKVVAFYEDNSRKEVNGLFSGYNPTTIGEQTILVKYSEAGIEATTTYTVTVSDKLQGIELDGDYQTEYEWGEELSEEGLIVYANMASGKQAITDYTISGYDKTRAGEQTVTVTYEKFEATYNVFVAEPDLVSISVDGAKTNFKLNENFSKGNAVVTAHYEDGSTKPVTAEFSGYDKNKLGTQTITVTYEEGTATFTTTYNVKVENFGIGISASTNGNIEFARGEDFNAEDVQVKLIMVNGETQIVSNSSVEFTGYNKNKLGEQTITAKYGEFTSTFTVKVIDPVVSISVSGQKTKYDVGEKIDKTGTITITTQSGSTSTVALSKATITGFDTQTAGTKTISVSYGGKTTTYNIVVKEAGSTSGLGCFGSLTGTFGLISLISTLGAGLLLLKKKED